MNHAHRVFPDLSRHLDRFTAGTRGRLSRALVNALRGRGHASPSPLNDSVSDGCRELRAAGFDDGAITAFFSALVEDTGRACGADRPSLLSGEMRWVPVRTRVLERVHAALFVSPSAPMLAMDHPNGPR